MKRLIAAAVLAASCAGPAGALVPPLPVAVISVERPNAPPGSGARLDALIAALESEGSFTPDRAPVPIKRVRLCGRGPAWEACIRDLLSRPREVPVPVPVAVVVAASANGEVRLTCVGPSRRWAHQSRQVVYVNLTRALAEPAHGPYRRRLDGCVMAAVAERGF